MTAAPRNAVDRLQRLLVMLPWLMERGEVPLDEVARRFGMSPEAVTRELELVAMCGLPPYVDEMVDVFIDDGIVVVGVPRLFTRPLRLTAPEGFSLLAAGRAAMELPGADPDGALARGLGKLASVLAAVDAGDGVVTDAGADDTAGVAIDLDAPAFVDVVTDAVAHGRELEIDYYSPATDEVTHRRIRPLHVFVDAGHWYVRADDDRSGERRTFRLDRVEDVTPTGARFDVPAADPETDGTADSADRSDGSDGSERPVFFVDAERAVVRVGPAAQWILDQYPIDEVRTLRSPKGWVEVTMPLASDRWLARLLIRLGPSARLVRPARIGDEARRLARRMLDAYDVTSP